MSGALGLVRFPDGSVKVARYNGTADVMGNRLGSDPMAWPSLEWLDDPAAGDVVPIELWTNYGAGMFWAGRATSEAIVGGLHPFGLEGWMGEMLEPDCIPQGGTPDWVTEYLAASR